MDRKTKEQVVADLHEKLKEFKLGVLASYSGLDVEKLTLLRNSLRKSEAEVKVVKNTLLGLASQGTDLSVAKDYLKGPLALILTNKDVVEPTKILVEFAKKNAQLELKAGVLDGKILTQEQLGALALLPSREILLGKLLSVMIGVQGSLVNVLSAVPRGLVQVLNAIREKKESGN
ncbi:MAG: 50S ribosomal protein L10 [Syntrophales bacterium]|nr:50S ribosomal protein L10 [Syntrophales bacterium]